MPSPERSILIGEDELDIREYLEMALKCLGYAVEVAQDSEEVLSFVETSRSEIAAVLLDTSMTNCPVNTLREIRHLDADLPVIMLSDNTSTEQVVNLMKSGATDLLCKPVSHDDLRKALGRALDLKPVH